MRNNSTPSNLTIAKYKYFREKGEAFIPHTSNRILVLVFKSNLRNSSRMRVKF